VSRALQELDARWDQKFELASLAHCCGLSPSRLAHLFSEQVGVSPQRYHERLRLQKAALMLRSTQLSVKEVAEQAGYQNAFYFTNRFRNAFGRSPTGFRHGAGDV
jgi:AraC family transcriptional regulator of arabinose operon